MGLAAIFLFFLGSIWIFAPHSHPFIIGFFVLLFGITAIYGYKPKYTIGDKTANRLKWEREHADEIIASRRMTEERLAREKKIQQEKFRKPVFNPQMFEKQIANLFTCHGYRVVETPYQGDHGIDLKAYKQDEFAIVQCKRYEGSVGEPVVRDFFGCLQHEGADIGFIVTTGTFTKNAKEWAEGKRIALVDGEMLQKMLDEINVMPSLRGVQ